MKTVLVLAATLFLTGCIVVPVVPNSVGVDIQPNVVYQQPIYQSTPIVVNRYPRPYYRNRPIVIDNYPRPIHRPRPYYRHHHSPRPQPRYYR